MIKNIFSSLFLLSAVVSQAQDTGFRLLPEVGNVFPIKGFNSDLTSAKGGLQFGLSAEKMWGKWGLSLYGGSDKSDIGYNDDLPASNSGLNISRASEKIQSYLQQFQFGIGPVYNQEISKKFKIDISSKFGFSKLSFPEFSEYVTIGDPLNQQYTLYQTNTEKIENSLWPMLLTSVRLNYEISKRFRLTFSTNYKFISNVESAYSYLGGDYSPDMSNEELIETISDAPTIAEKKRCHFNSIGLTLGVSYLLCGGKDNDVTELDTTDHESPSDSCRSALVQNGEFDMGNKKVPVPANWAAGYGIPKFLNTIGEGCFDPGYVQLTGNLTTGDAVVQTFSNSNKIILGQHYVVSVGVRFKQELNSQDYAKLRAIAYNGVLPSTGSHPDPGTNVAIIGRSGKIKDCGDWSVIEFPVWIANNNFDGIAFNVFTNDGKASTLWIDNVSVCEVSEGYGCDTVGIDAKGNPIMPPGYGNVPPGFKCQPEAEEDEYYNGTLQDLYGQLNGYDGTTNWYTNASDKCFTLGGTIPDEVLKYNCDDSLKALGIKMTCEEFEKMLKDVKIDTSTRAIIPSMPPFSGMDNMCELDLPVEYDRMAFHGRDIIYIHGLQLDHLCDRANLVKGALADWPFEQNEFYTGYYKDVANANWQPHIDYFLRGKGNLNRYLIVTYNCSQGAEAAIHSVLSQIREAMESGKEVQYVPGDPRGTNCFGRNYVFISHSTGAIIADAALTISHYTKTLTPFANQFGNIGLIADRCRGRVSLHGAFTGSSLATLLVAAQSFPVISGIASAGLTKGVCKTDLTLAAHHQLILNSILVDLIPAITRAKWWPFIAAVPVPVLNVSGGHPTAIIPVLKFSMHIGYDDGVISMDCGNTLINQPSSFVSSFPPKVYDMGINRVRANHYYLDQRLGPNLYGSTFTPRLSPTGMVQPVSFSSPLWLAPNHYSFVQSASEHLQPKDMSYFNNCTYKETAFNQAPNYEEELVVSDPSLYSSGIVDNAIKYEMGEEIRGEYINYPTIRIKRIKGFPVPVVYWKRFYIWKRTYHRLKGDCVYDYDYVYQYLFKN